MTWRQFVMDLESLNPDRVEEIFSRHGAPAISFADAGDQPVLVPGVVETRLWPASRITGLFSTDAATRENAQKDSIGDCLFVTQDVAEITGSFDIVVANVLAEPLVENAGDISDRVAPGGSLALSGILLEQTGSVIDAYGDSIEFESPKWTKRHISPGFDWWARGSERQA